MSSPKYPRGSEWRKWDLQVHTPFSALSNGFGDDFDQYAKILLQKAVEQNIAAIGVTDYFSIEGYKRLRKLVSENDELEKLVGTEVAKRAQDILLLPNIELRTSVIITRPNGKDSRVNFHLIFCDDIEPSAIEDHFLREIKFTAESNPGHPDERWSLSFTNLENLGKKLKAQHENFSHLSDLYVGMMNAVVTHEEVTGALERQASRFKDRFLIAVPADEDLSECSWNGQGHLTRKLLIQKSHILFSGNPGTRSFGLGKKHSTVQDFVNEFRGLKPCVHSSDCHSYETLFEPTEKRYTWIKADPTFQGLRQLLNEPEDRIFIGTMPPSIERVSSRPTRVVKTLSISKIPSSSLPERWFDCSLTLNPELVAIIGNKGNGKSALADVLGLLGNTPRHASFSFLREDRFRDPKNNKAKHFEASFTWVDKTRDGPVALDRDPDFEAVEKVRYIPQNYLEEICNEVGLGKGSRFYAELQQVIFSHVPESERLGCDTLDELLDQRGAEVKKTIDILVLELRDINKQIASHEERLSPQHRKILELQLAERQRELQAHEQTRPKEILKPEDDPTARQQSKETSSALEIKQKSLNEIEKGIAERKARDVQLAKKRATAEKLLGRLRNLRRQVDGVLTEAAAEFSELGLTTDQVVSIKLDTDPVDRIVKQTDEERSSIADELDLHKHESLEQRRLAIANEIQHLQNSLTATQRAYQDYLTKLREWQVTRDKVTGSAKVSGSIVHIEGLLAELNTVPQTLRQLSRHRNKKALEIYNEKQKLRSYYENYYGAVQNFLSNHPLATDEHFKVTFNVAMVQAGFSDAFLSKVNQRKVGTFSGVEEGGGELKALLDATNWSSCLSVLRFTRKLIKKLQRYGDRPLAIADQLKQGETAQDLYDLIFSFGYLSPIYRLTWDKKGLEQLSPGERGNLLLIFYLLVDRDDIPLVIDQPEENLDNQTVVKTLVPCMKDAKKRRQIVMVTHNPNLAVVCDAEQVIYAEIRKERGSEVTYLTGAIEDPVINKKIVDVLEGTRPAFDMREAKYLP